MSQDSPIEWTDKSWNPTRGCRRVSPGCINCYAEKIAYRFSGPGFAYEGLISLGKQGPRWNGAGRFIPDSLDAPLGWQEPRKIFVNSMSDLFFDAFSNEEIAAVFGVMAASPRHTFQVLTKRPGRAVAWFKWAEKEASQVNAGRGMSVAALCLAIAQKACAHRELARNVDRTCGQPWPLRYVWIGTSTEDQQRANERIPHLLRVPAAVRFVSYEPALGPVDLTRILLKKSQDLGPDVTFDALKGWYGGADDGRTRIDWVIAGGESGTGARPCAVEWLQDARQQCAEAGIAFFCKQLGAHQVSEARAAETESEMKDLLGPDAVWPDDRWLWRCGIPKGSKGGDLADMPEELRVREFPVAVQS